MIESAMKWERRWHPLRREWVVLAAHRQGRPWSGHTLEEPPEEPSAWIDGCYLCPRNARVHGAVNPNFSGIFAFDNDHPCVGAAAPDTSTVDDLYRRASAKGLARVICYGPEHHLRLCRMPQSRVVALLESLEEQVRDCRADPDVRGILIFENNGESVGVSNPHPHCQVYGLGFHPTDFARELAACDAHFAETGRVLLEEIVAREIADGERIVAQNDFAVAFVPWFARFAYEVYVVPRAPVTSLAELSDSARAGFAAVWKEVLIRFDNLWNQPFPYIMAAHEPPTDGGQYESYRCFFAFAPPMRAPGLMKHLAGPETGAGTFIGDTWPEDKAAELRAVAATHYLDVR